MPSIKVIYRETARRLFVTNDVTWSTLESRLRELFSIPDGSSIALSYTDEDDDVVTLSTDIELDEVMNHSGTTGTMTFSLIVAGEEPTGTREGWILEGATSRTSGSMRSAVNEVEEEDAERGDVLSETSERASENEPFITDDASARANEGETSSSDPQNIQLAAQFQKLVDQFRDVINNNPQLVEAANDIMEQITRSVPVDIEACREWFRSFRETDDSCKLGGCCGEGCCGSNCCCYCNNGCNNTPVKPGPSNLNKHDGNGNGNGNNQTCNCNSNSNSNSNSNRSCNCNNSSDSVCALFSPNGCRVPSFTVCTVAKATFFLFLFFQLIRFVFCVFSFLFPLMFFVGATCVFRNMRRHRWCCRRHWMWGPRHLWGRGNRRRRFC